MDKRCCCCCHGVSSALKISYWEGWCQKMEKCCCYGFSYTHIVVGGVLPEDGEVITLLFPWFQLHPHCGGRGGAEDSRTASTQHQQCKFFHVLHLSFFNVLTFTFKETIPLVEFFFSTLYSLVYIVTVIGGNAGLCCCVPCYACDIYQVPLTHFVC